MGVRARHVTGFDQQRRVHLLDNGGSLNDRVQGLNIAALSEAQKAAERLNFEGPWVRANWFRTAMFGLTSVYLLILSLVSKV